MLASHDRFNAILLAASIFVASALLLVFAQTSLALSGELDTRFASKGSVILKGYDAFMPQREQLAVAPNGSFAVVGAVRRPAMKSADGSETYLGNRWAISRFTKDGKPDATFGNRGRVVLRLPGESDKYPRASVATSVRFDRRGRLIVSGAIDHATYADFQAASGRSPMQLGFGDVQDNHLGIVRLTRRGNLDHSFGKRGVTQVSLFAKRDNYGPADIRAIGVGELPSGRIVVGSTTRINGVEVFAFDGAGKRVTKFGAEGKSEVSNANVLRVGSGGSIFVGGIRYEGPNAANQIHIWRVTKLKANGRADMSFGELGVTEIKTKFNTRNSEVVPFVRTTSFDIAPVGGGRLLVTAARTHGSMGHTVLAVARLGSRGRLDKSFGVSGIARAPLSLSSSSSGASVVMNREGEIYAGGTFDQSPFNRPGELNSRVFSQGIVAKFDKRGKPDTRWGTNGVQQMARSGVESCPYGPQLAIQSSRVLANGCWRVNTWNKPAEVFRLKP